MMLFISFLYLYKQHLEFRLPSGPKAGSGPVPVLGRPVPIRFRYGKKIPVRFRYSGYRVPWSTTNTPFLLIYKSIRKCADDFCLATDKFSSPLIFMISSLKLAIAIINLIKAKTILNIMNSSLTKDIEMDDIAKVDETEQIMIKSE